MTDQFPVPAGWHTFGTHADVDNVPEYLIFSRELDDTGYPLWERAGKGEEPVMQWARCPPEAMEAAHDAFYLTKRGYGEKNIWTTSTKRALEAAMEALFQRLEQTK